MRLYGRSSHMRISMKEDQQASLPAHAGYMNGPRCTSVLVRLILLFPLLCGGRTPATVWAQAQLENSRAASFESESDVRSSRAASDGANETFLNPPEVTSAGGV